MPIAPPVFGWPTQLTTFLNQNYNGKWAYSGSFAMYCHADRLDQECRQPNDIDILIDGQRPAVGFPDIIATNVCHLSSDLSDGVFNGTTIGHVGFNAVEAVVDNCLIGQHRVKIDLGKPSDRFGRLGGAMNYNSQAGPCRIMTIHQLIAAKDDPGATDEKHQRDLRTLRLWLGLLRQSLPT